MREIQSIILMCMACATLLLQLYGRSKLACDKMRIATTSSFLTLLLLFIVLNLWDRMNSDSAKL